MDLRAFRLFSPVALTNSAIRKPSGRSIIAMTVAATLLLLALTIYRIQERISQGLNEYSQFHSDEGVFSTTAIKMAYRADPNPYWFAHPASTQIYPLAFVYWVAIKLDSKPKSLEQYLSDPAFH